MKVNRSNRKGDTIFNVESPPNAEGENYKRQPANLIISRVRLQC
jgi:hypothetical protein